MAGAPFVAETVNVVVPGFAAVLAHYQTVDFIPMLGILSNIGESLFELRHLGLKPRVVGACLPGVVDGEDGDVFHVGLEANAPG